MTKKEQKNNLVNSNKNDNINLPKDKYFYDVADVMKIRNCKSRKAYEIIAKLNKELTEKGILTDKGRVSVKYYHERYSV